MFSSAKKYLFKKISFNLMDGLFKMGYGKVTERILKKIKNIVGEENIFTDKDELEKYSHDEMPIPKFYFPEVVVKPENTQQVSKILVLANKEKIPVTPRCGGTGLCGGCVPIYGGILLSLEKMNRVLEVDEENFVAVVEAGVALSDLYKAVEAKGLYYPLLPGEESACVGGNVATNAGGMRAIKYGVTRNFVLGLEAVLPTGEIIQTGGKFVKSSTGYNLTQLLIGSEGTLAVITKIVLRLMITPKTRFVLLVPFNNLYDAIKTVPKILKCGIIPTGIEFMEKDAIKIVEEYVGRKIPYSEVEASLLIIFDAEKEEEAYEASEIIGKVCMENGALDVLFPDTEKAKKELLEFREKFYYALKNFGKMDLADVVVPRSRIAEFLIEVKKISKRYGLPVVGYGHAGDGNVHLHVYGDGKLRLKIFNEIYKIGKKFDGAISGEHGIGLEKKRFFLKIVDKKQLELMKGIKKVFDPNNILNPGKIFD